MEGVVYGVDGSPLYTVTVADGGVPTCTMATAAYCTDAVSYGIDLAGSTTATVSSAMCTTVTGCEVVPWTTTIFTISSATATPYPTAAKFAVFRFNTQDSNLDVLFEGYLYPFQNSELCEATSAFIGQSATLPDGTLANYPSDFTFQWNLGQPSLTTCTYTGSSNAVGVVNCPGYLQIQCKEFTAFSYPPGLGVGQYNGGNCNDLNFSPSIYCDASATATPGSPPAVPPPEKSGYPTNAGVEIFLNQQSGGAASTLGAFDYAPSTPSNWDLCSLTSDFGSGQLPSLGAFPSKMTAFTTYSIVGCTYIGTSTTSGIPYETSWPDSVGLLSCPNYYTVICFDGTLVGPWVNKPPLDCGSQAGTWTPQVWCPFDALLSIEYS
jgi:hypothetical protein